MSNPAISSDHMVKAVVDAIHNRKGRGVTHIDLTSIPTAAASHFIVAQGTSPTQVSAIADSVRDSLLEQHGIKPYNYDGYTNSQWIVIDYGDLFVHIFVPQQRELYNLEGLYADATITEIPDLD